MAAARGSRTRKIIKKPLVFKLFSKKMVLALEFWTPPFRFLTNALSNLLVLVAKLSVTPRLGLQRHLTSKGALNASQGVYTSASRGSDHGGGGGSRRRP